MTSISSKMLPELRMWGMIKTNADVGHFEVNGLKVPIKMCKLNGGHFENKEVINYFYYYQLYSSSLISNSVFFSK